MKLGDWVIEQHSTIEGMVTKIETSLYGPTRMNVQREGVDSYGNLWAETWFFEGKLKKKDKK